MSDKCEVKFLGQLFFLITVVIEFWILSGKDFQSQIFRTFLCNLQVRRRIKQVPLAFFKATPTSLFWDSDFAGWTFRDQHNGKLEDETKENGFSKMVENDDREHVKRPRIKSAWLRYKSIHFLAVLIWEMEIKHKWSLGAHTLIL